MIKKFDYKLVVFSIKSRLLNLKKSETFLNQNIMQITEFVFQIHLW